jgi:hypothetical protein
VRRTRLINFHADENRRALYQDAARSRGLNLSEYIRQTLDVAASRDAIQARARRS